MSSEWSDPSGKWLRRFLLAALPTGILWLGSLALCALAFALGWEPAGGGWWVYVAASAATGILLIAQGVTAWRRARRDSR